MNLPGPALTALGVAMIRAAETRRTDRLYDDPWAQRFVDAAMPGVPVATWERVGKLADVMHESRTVGVRLVDDMLLAAARAGLTQIVLLGAGLDAHAFRLAWPQPVDLFEVDLPALFEFKEQVLAGAHPDANCRRRTVAADLSSDWGHALRDAGFRPDLPTCWVDHVSISLPRAAAVSVARRVTEWSSPGSRYSFPAMTPAAVDATMGTVAGAKELYRGDAPADEERGLGADGIAQLRGSGWSVQFEGVADIAARYGRPGVGQGSVNVVAVR